VQAQGTEVKKRADKLAVALIVRTNNSGEPRWLATWRDSTRKPVMKTVGPAHLRARPPRRNPFRPDDGGRDTTHESRTAASWTLDWEKRRGRAPAGVYDERAALARARDLMLAREVEIEAEKEAEAGGPKLFGEVADAWLARKAEEVADRTLKPSSLKDYRSMLRRADEPVKARGRGRTAWVMRAFERRPIRDITAGDVDAFEATLRKAKLAPQTRTKYLVTLSMIFAYAESQGWITENPVKAKGRQKRKRRKRQEIPEVYSFDVVERIAAKVPDTMLGDAVRVAALTGLRQGELLALRWRDVDFIGRKITVRSRYVPGEEVDDVPKSGRVRSVPMSDQAGAVLDRLSRRDEHTRKGDLVVTDGGEHIDPSTLRRAYMKARDAVIEAAAKEGETLPVVTYHGLRHTFATRCATADVPLFTLKNWMGHADIATTLVYSHWQPHSDDADRLSRAFADGTPQEAAEEVTVA
jgi:integrase